MDNGTAASLNWGVDNGFINDADLDSDGVEGPADQCPAEFSTCWDQDGDGCIDIPDPDDDVESGDGADTEYFEFEDPPIGEVFYYVVRARNSCPAAGLVGTDSQQHLRVAKSCP